LFKALVWDLLYCIDTFKWFEDHNRKIIFQIL